MYHAIVCIQNGCRSWITWCRVISSIVCCIELTYSASNHPDSHTGKALHSGSSWQFIWARRAQPACCRWGEYLASIHNILNVLNLAFRLILYHRGLVSAFPCPTSSLSRNGDMTFVVIITLRFFERIIQPHHGINCYCHSCIDLFMDSSKYACGSHGISPVSNKTLLEVW